MSFPEALYVGKSALRPAGADWDEILADPRGFVLMFEPPRKNAKYIMGLDPTQGVTGWTRSTRVDGDHKIDNGVIEIFEVDGEREGLWKDEGGIRIPDLDPETKRQRVRFRDVQVCEFAAPIDAVEIARVADILGRVYAGVDEEQCPLIWESWPGCGMLTTQELLRLDYQNLWHWERFANTQAEETQVLGWQSTFQSQKVLWYRARRHLMQENVRLRSTFLIQEYANAEIDLEKMRARAAYGWHDDRFMAANMAFWAGHKWTYDERGDVEVRESAPVLDYQRMAPGLDDYESFGDWKSRATADWYD